MLLIKAERRMKKACVKKFYCLKERERDRETDRVSVRETFRESKKDTGR